jgi:hypothetical protein
MVEHPIFIERSLLIDGDKAVIARDAEKAKSFLVEIE